MQQINALPSQTGAPAPSNTIELNGIHIPDPISDFPIAYGWWLLALLIIIAIISSIIKIRKKAKLNKVKKQALMQLKNNASLNNNDIIALLKCSAMHYFSRVELAQLFGHPLQHFFISKLPAKKQQSFAKLSEQAFLNQYQATTADTVDENLQQGAVLWLTYALPPKPLKNKINVSQKTSQGVNQ